MRKTRIFNRPELKEVRRYLRNHATSAEAILWTYLKGRQLSGRKFRRQHSIGNYIVDFYCPQENLVVELDGEHHFWDEEMQHDSARTHYLTQLGLQLIRFENKWVFEDIDSVLTTIQKTFNA